jgi:hypothetical protein
MNMIVKTFTGTTGNHNVDLGMVPDIAIFINTNAVTTESYIIIWFKDLNNEVNITAAGECTYVTSNTITAYDSSSWDTGTSNDDDDPVRNKGFQGITVADAKIDDSDVIIVIGIGADKVIDGGDAADW